MSYFTKGDVVQFNENHKWCGCLGIIEEVKYYDNDVRFMIGCLIPEKGTAYIFSMESNDEFEYIGKSLFMPAEDNTDE